MTTDKPPTQPSAMTTRAEAYDAAMGDEWGAVPRVSPDPEALTNEATARVEATPAGVVLGDETPLDIALSVGGEKNAIDGGGAWAF